jgi:hypothetical protein
MSDTDDPVVLPDTVSVTMALACENFSQDPQQRIYLHTVIDQLNAVAFPVTTNAFFVIFAFQRKSPGFLMQCKIDIVPENGEPVASQVLKDVVFSPDSPTSRQIVGFAGVTWPKPGNYVVRFLSRGKVIASFVLPLAQIKLPGLAKS